MKRILSQFIPFLLLGIAIVVFAFGMVLLAYLLVFGALVGLGLYIINWIRNKFFAPKKEVRKVKSRSGRIIDSDDWKKL